MAHRRDDVVARALQLLADVGLPDLTMRRLGAELGVQPSAIYHHFPNKQALLGAVADEILEQGTLSAPLRPRLWQRRAALVCGRVRMALLRFPDGADLVATMWAYGLGGQAAYDALRDVLLGSGLDEPLAEASARTLLHFTYGHAIDEQAHEQASRLGAIQTPGRDVSDFENGLDLIISGIATRVGQPAMSRAR